MKDSKAAFAPLTLWLHWIIAIVFIGMIAVGFYMSSYRVMFLYPLHKSIGMLLLLLILWRVIWRYINGWPIPVKTYPRIEQILAKVVHWLLILGILLMPISGMLMSAASGHGLAVFGFELFPAQLDSAGKASPIAPTLGKVANNLHDTGAYVMLVAISLHIIGALKHHLIDKDGTLKRMLGQDID